MAVEPKTGEYFDELEIMSAAAREKYRDERLTATVARAYRNAPAVRRMLDEVGIPAGEIRTVADLAKLPITRKTDLIELQKKFPPYGGFLAIPPERVDRVFISPGPIYEPLQTARIKWFAKSFWAAGFRPGDIVINTFTYHMSPAGLLFQEGLRDCGATAVPMGTGNTEIQLQTIRDLKVTGFLGTPSFLSILLKRADELGYNPRRDFTIKRAWFTGEMLPPSMRKTFTETYGISTAQAYAVTETGGALAYECYRQAGMHLMDEYIIEVVDVQTGKPLGPGEVGEVVVTPIHNPVWGLLRFGTGDLSSYTEEPCACGRTTHRLTGILGRIGDAVKVRGMFVVAKQAEQVCGGFAPVGRFQLRVTREGERDVLVLRTELKAELAEESRRKLTEELNQKFQDVCRVKIDRFEFLSAGTLPEKSPVLTDERVWK